MEILLENFLEFIKNNYYENSDVWNSYETNEVVTHEDIIKEFIKQYNFENYQI